MPPEEAPAYITDLPLEKSILADFRGLDEKGKKAAIALRRRAYQTAVREEEPLCKSF